MNSNAELETMVSMFCNEIEGERKSKHFDESFEFLSERKCNAHLAWKPIGHAIPNLLYIISCAQFYHLSSFIINRVNYINLQIIKSLSSSYSFVSQIF